MGERMGKSRNIGIQEMAVGNILQRINAVWAQSNYVTLAVGYSKIAKEDTDWLSARHSKHIVT
jgi:hypothetical protein